MNKPKVGVRPSILRVIFPVCICLAFLATCIPNAIAVEEQRTPPRWQTQKTTSFAPLQTAKVKAAVVRSWDEGSASVFAELNDEWPLYGRTSIYIDKTLAGVDRFSYQDLVQTRADVVILSNPAGGMLHFTKAEIDALKQYVSEGHNLIGTYRVFQWDKIDNRHLTSLFGLHQTIPFNPDTVEISNLFNVLNGDDPLFTDLPSSWTSQGYYFTQTPLEGWSHGNLDGAVMVAECDAFKSMISVYTAYNYAGIYIANMPEYNGGPLDKQLLYNAITYPKPIPPPAINLVATPNPAMIGGPLSALVDLENQGDPFLASVKLYVTVGADDFLVFSRVVPIRKNVSINDFVMLEVDSLPPLPDSFQLSCFLHDHETAELIDWDVEIVHLSAFD